MTGDHLSDEVLSAHLDSDADRARPEAPESPATVAMAAELEAHLSGCAECRRRLAGLEAARQLVRTPPVPPSVEERAAAVAAVIRRARLGSIALDADDFPGVAAGHDNGTVHRPGPALAPAWYRRPGLLVGAAAVAVALAIALPVALASKSNPTSSAALHARAGSIAKNARRLKAPSASSPANVPHAPTGSASASTPTTASPLPDLGAVNSPSQLQAEVANLAETTGSSQGTARPGVTTATTASTATRGPPVRSLSLPASTCVQATRSASHGGAYGPATVATATYRGTPALVMEFWPTPTAPPAGQGVIAVASQSGCALLATTPT